MAGTGDIRNNVQMGPDNQCSCQKLKSEHTWANICTDHQAQLKIDKCSIQTHQLCLLICATGGRRRPTGPIEPPNGGIGSKKGPTGSSVCGILATPPHGCPARDNDVRQFCTEEIVEGRVVNGCWSSRFLSFLSPADWRPALQEANPPTDGLMHWGGQGGCPGDGQGDAWSFGQTSLLLTAVG